MVSHTGVIAGRLSPIVHLDVIAGAAGAASALARCKFLAHAQLCPVCPAKARVASLLDSVTIYVSPVSHFEDARIWSRITRHSHCCGCQPDSGIARQAGSHSWAVSLPMPSYALFALQKQGSAAASLNHCIAFLARCLVAKYLR